MVTTEAGKRLLDAPWMLLPGQPLMADQIAAIEAEAVGDERARIVAAVRRLDPDAYADDGDARTAINILDDVLATIEGTT